MNINCSIIRDLLPLYCDEICSEESKAMIEEHLMTCESCNEILQQMQSDTLGNEILSKQETDKSNVLKKIRKTIFQNKVIIAVTAVVCTIAIIFGLYATAVLITKPIAYREGLVSINVMEDGTINTIYNDDNYASAYGLEKEITVDGHKKKVEYICYTKSFWSNYIEKRKQRGSLEFQLCSSMGGEYSITEEGIRQEYSIDAVYYLAADYSKLNGMDEKEFMEYAKDAILLWER